MIRQDMLPHRVTEGDKNYIKAVNKGVLKVMSKMGISTLQSYRGAQIFEAIGLNAGLRRHVLSLHRLRIGGIGIDEIAEEVAARHRARLSRRVRLQIRNCDWGGQYQWRAEGEYHMYNPETVHKLQNATRTNNYRTSRNTRARRWIDEPEAVHAARPARVQVADQPVPIDEVESVEPS